MMTLAMNSLPDDSGIRLTPAAFCVGLKRRMKRAWRLEGVPRPVATLDAAPEALVPETSLLRVPLPALDGGEIIILAVKPAIASPFFHSARWIAVFLLLSLGILWSRVSLAGVSTEWLAQGGLAGGALGLAYATVRWSATWYVLTNRRVVEIHGVRAPRVRSIPLVEIRNTYVTAGPHERCLRLSSITFVPRSEGEPLSIWRHLNQGEDLHRRIRRAIENALDSLPPA